MIEDEIPEEKKALKGWGSWTGVGIKEKKINPEIEKKRRMQQFVNNLASYILNSL